MKTAGIILLIIGAVCIALLAFGWLGTVPRGTDLPWTYTGPAIFGSFFLGAGVALLIAHRKSKRTASE